MDKIKNSKDMFSFIKEKQDAWDKWKVIQQELEEKEEYLKYLKSTEDFPREVLIKLIEEEEKEFSYLVEESKKIEPQIIQIDNQIKKFTYDYDLSNLVSEVSKKIIGKRENKHEKKFLSIIFLLRDYFGVDIFFPLVKNFFPPSSYDYCEYKYNFSHEEPDSLIDYFSRGLLLNDYRIGVEFSEFFGYGKIKNVKNNKEGAKEAISLNESKRKLENLLKKNIGREMDKINQEIYKSFTEKRISDDIASTEYEINVEGSLFENLAKDIENRIDKKNKDVQKYIDKSKLNKVSLFLWTTTPISLVFHKIENNRVINKPNDNEFDKLLTIYAIFKKILLKVTETDIKFGYLTLFFGTVQFEQKDKTEIVRKIIERDIVDKFFLEEDGCCITLLNNIYQQSHQELSTSKNKIISLFTRSNNYSILVHLIPSKMKYFVNKKIKEIEEEFAKKYKDYGPIGSWSVEEVIMDGFGYLSRFNSK